MLFLAALLLNSTCFAAVGLRQARCLPIFPTAVNALLHVPSVFLFGIRLKPWIKGSLHGSKSATIMNLKCADNLQRYSSRIWDAKRIFGMNSSARPE